MSKDLSDKVALLTEQLPKKISENNGEWILKYDNLKSRLKKYEKLQQEIDEANLVCSLK